MSDTTDLDPDTSPTIDPRVDLGAQLYAIQAELAEDPQYRITEFKPIHFSILEMHLQGFRNVQIANTLNVHIRTVSYTINSAIAKNILAQHAAHARSRVNGLLDKAIDVYQDGLMSDNLKLQWNAADRIVDLDRKMSGGGTPGGGMETAETFAQRLIEEMYKRAQGMQPQVAKPPGEVYEGEATHD